MEKKAKLEPLQEPKTWVRVAKGFWLHQPSLHRISIEMRADENNRGCSIKFKDVNSWDDVWETTHDVAKDSSSMWFSLMYTGGLIADLPTRLSFASLRNITSLTMQYYPTLEHLDLRGSLCLEIFMLQSMSLEIRDNPDKYQLPRRIRISGLAQCLKLQKFIFFGVDRRSFLLEIKAPIRNLQALTHVIIGSQCINQRLPLEFGASPSLIFAEFNATHMTRPIKSKRKFVVCLCMALHGANLFNSLAFVKALVSGPIHDPSLIHDVANKLSVKLD